MEFGIEKCAMLIMKSGKRHMMPVNHILRKCTTGYELSRSQENINRLMYIKLSAKKRKKKKNWKKIHTVRIYSQDIGMEFGIEKCAMLVMKSSKRHRTDGIEIPNQEKIRTLGENETYKYLGILVPDNIKQEQMKHKIQKYLRWTRKLLETKLSCRNLIKGINTWALPLVRYSGLFLKWTRDELKQMDRRTRKLMTMHKALHSRDGVVSRKVWGRGLASIEDRVDASIEQLEDYKKKHEKGLITAIRNNTTETGDLRRLVVTQTPVKNHQLSLIWKTLEE